ncbi:MAG TPA: hypothetical protein VMT69_13980 [Kineosporiaceae bacterium]|nr:hypothetical protein [Kineosporiaceae bacterium]
MSSRRGLRALLLLAAAGATVGAVMTMKENRKIAVMTTDEIEAQLAALDPVTRAEVIARLGKDAAGTIRKR